MGPGRVIAAVGCVALLAIAACSSGEDASGSADGATVEEGIADSTGRVEMVERLDAPGGVFGPVSAFVADDGTALIAFSDPPGTGDDADYEGVLSISETTGCWGFDGGAGVSPTVLPGSAELRMVDGETVLEVAGRRISPGERIDTAGGSYPMGGVAIVGTDLDGEFEAVLSRCGFVDEASVVVLPARLE